MHLPKQFVSNQISHMSAAKLSMVGHFTNQSEIVIFGSVCMCAFVWLLE